MFTYKKDFYKLFTVDTFVWMTMCVCMPFLNAYYTQNNITKFQIGLLAAMSPVAAILIQPLWAGISDRTGRRRLLLQALALLAGVSYLLFLRGNTFFVFCSSALVLMLFNSAIMPLNDAIITKEAREKNANFAIIRMGGTVGFAIVVLGVGNYLKAHPTHMFVLAFVMYLAYALICFMLPKDEPAADKKVQTQVQAQESKPAAKLNFNLKDIFVSNEVIFVLVIASVIQLVLSFHSAFLTVYVVNLGYDQSMIGILFCISAFSEVPILMIIHKLMKRYRTLSLLCVALVLSAVRLILVPAGALPFIIMSQVMQGPTYMINHYGCVTYISEHAKEGKMSQAQSVLVMLQAGLATVVGSLIGGLLSENLGLPVSFMIMAAFTVFASLICFIALQSYYKRQGIQKTA